MEWLNRETSAKIAIPIVATVVAALVAIGMALGQPAGVPQLSITSPTGLEQINVLNTGPQIATVTINQIRNSTGYLLVAGGTTVATQLTNNQDNLIATGAITTWNVNLPTAPADGQQVNIACSGGTATTLNVAATLPAGVTIVGAATPTCTTGGASGAEYTYTATGNIWYRIR